MRLRFVNLMSILALACAGAVINLGQIAPQAMKLVRGRVVIEGAMPVQPVPKPAPLPARAAADTLPALLSDAEFWRMVTDFSEPDGSYPFENFVSNERNQQAIIPALKQATRLGEVYIGVAPEQNFTYAAALQAKMAFVVDIRRQNMLEHLLYKALFELSLNRVEFVSRLFSRKLPAGLDDKSTASALLAAVTAAKADADLHIETLNAIKSSFQRHGYRLWSEDLLKIEYIYQVFYRGGPGITYEFASANSPPTGPSFTQIMNMSDDTGHNWSFLASEDTFKYVREMQAKNLIVPLVGNFAGPTAIRSIARYLKEHNANVSAFYASNVESYLSEKEIRDFYGNLLALPVDATTTMIRYVDLNHTPAIPWWNSSLSYLQAVSPMNDLVKLAAAGTLPAYHDVIRLIPQPAASANATPRFVLPLSLGPGRPFLTLAITPQAEGAFQVAVPIGTAQVGAPTGLPPSYSIKSITYGATDLMKDSMNVAVSDNNELVITLAIVPAAR